MHDELAVLVREHLLGGQLIDRAGMPTVIPRGVDVMAAVAIDEWMGSSPIYTKRMQRLLAYEGDTVETCLKGMQLDIGAPPEFMDFRMEVIDDHHGAFHLDHCGALMDVEPMGEDYVVAMCHHIEDPTFDATGWATNPKLRMVPIHRPPRVPADRHPHCSWSVVIDEAVDDNPEPEMAKRVGRSLLARLPVTAIGPVPDDDLGWRDYAGPLDPDLDLRAFATPVLRAMLDEVAIQAHLLVLAFGLAVEDRTSTEEAVDAIHKQATGVAGVVAARIRAALGLGSDAAGLAQLFTLHPLFLPASYVAVTVEVVDDGVHLELGPCPARDERGFASWITGLVDGDDRALTAIAHAADPRWTVASAGPGRWSVVLGDEPAPTLSEVKVAQFSTGATHVFIR